MRWAGGAIAGVLVGTLAACSTPPSPPADPAVPAPSATASSVAAAKEIAAPPAAAPEPDLVPPGLRAADPTALALVREHTARFYRGETDLLYDQFSSELRQVLSLEQLSTLHEYVGQNFGKEIRVLAEDAQSNDEYRAFVRWARFDKIDEVIEIRWTLRRDDNSIAEFWIRPAGRGATDGS